jgi:hypothetical protein
LGLVQDDAKSSELADASLDDHWLVGTPAYMAPEQAAGRRASKATDWYAVGAMLYRALTGQLPFDGSLNEVLLRKQTEDPPAPSALIDGLPQDLEQLALQLLQRSAEARADEANVRRRLVLEFPPARISQPPEGERLVGREAELKWLQHALDESRRGVPQVLLLEGHSGFGKTALAQHFCREVRRDPSAVLLAGRCYPREALPYKALDAVIDALSRYLSRLPEARAHELLPRNCRALTGLFPVLERVPAIQTQRSLALPPATLSERRERAFAALKELLGRISDQGPLVLLIENLEWGDEDSAELLLRVCSAPDPPALLLIGTHRPRAEIEGAFFARLGPPSFPVGEAVRQQRSIGPLAPEHAFALCQDLLHGSDRVAWRIAEETAGDPLLISLLCEHLREHPDGIPSGARAPLEALVDFELTRLSPDTRSCLDLIAVAGAPVLPEVLAEALGFTPEQTRNCLSQLTEEGLLQLVYHQGRESISVRHERIAQALTARMTAGEVAQYHGSWADALLARGNAEPETLADHYWKAGEESLARRHAIVAAGRAERGLAFDRAVHLYERALTLAEHDASELTCWSASPRRGCISASPATRRPPCSKLLGSARRSAPPSCASARQRSGSPTSNSMRCSAGRQRRGSVRWHHAGSSPSISGQGAADRRGSGACVSRRSDRAASVLVVLAGGLRVEQAAGRVEVGPARSWALSPFLHNTPRLADVHATLDGTRVLRITRASLEELNQSQPQLALQLTLNLARIPVRQARQRSRPGISPPRLRRERGLLRVSQHRENNARRRCPR